MSKANVKNYNTQYIYDILAKKSLIRIINSYQPTSIAEKYRLYKNPLKYNFAKEDSYLFWKRLKNYFLTKEDVDLNVIKPINFEVCLIVKIFFLRLNNSPLPKKNKTFLKELKTRTNKSRKTEARKSDQIHDFFFKNLN